MRRHYNNADDYDNPHHDERQERTTASEHGRRNFDEIGGWWTAGSWGDED